MNGSIGIDAIIEELKIGGCDTISLNSNMWQCFLMADKETAVGSAVRGHNHALIQGMQNEVSQINRIGMDAAKLHCCEKAQNKKCQRLCLQTHSNEWTETLSYFESVCLMSPEEQELRQCIEEVDEPCELGCDGLSFCTNFNNRPTELFRSCKTEADEAALSDLHYWQQNGSVQLLGIQIPIRNMTKCAPEKWKAIACALQLKPCSRHGLSNQICHSDCYEILSECIDWSRLNTRLSPDAICSRLNPQQSPEQPCISLLPYLEESDAPKNTGGHHGLSSPCKGHPCNASQVCLPQRNESNAYACIPGCSMGEASNYMVPFGAYVRVPVLISEKVLMGSANFKVCRCGLEGRIEHCQPLPSFSYENCVLPGGRSIKHANTFELECNLCSCYAAEITCTKKQCRFPGEFFLY